ncbi:Mg chelatase-like protein [Gardnerella vaginalis]|uniref:Mg chelatase-like protein n=1 Tax=Gardnerella vaginalis TaxID=2702 RepID=A0A135ZAD6_GARVA|nr:YifB family Mg chelatase-like AAA ATPase [Gardnerella vaginalis]KXI18589.1 Mg chelatase-like protein [Gardnerella vaginalis]
MTIGNALSVGLIGLKAFTIQIQSFISPGLPAFSIIGLPDTSLSEARERVKSAYQSLHCDWPESRITVNLSPASMPKSGSSYDLAIASSILSAKGIIPLQSLDNTVILGELNLDGTVLPINGLLPISLFAQEMGIKRMIIPQANLDEANLVDGIDAIGIKHILDLVDELHGKLDSKNRKYAQLNRERALQATGNSSYEHIQVSERCNKNFNRGENNSNNFDYSNKNDTENQKKAEQKHTSAQKSILESDIQHSIGDMSEVLGQEHTKWALQVAAAGGHHVMMIGPPGSGKTMLASRMPGIMCPLNEKEQLEVASIRSLCGTLPYYGISDIPPFEAPHHTSSSASLIGGGTGIAKPGIITRAHCGVLFMDEAPEFSPRVLQTLREPLESGFIAVSRSKGTTFYPAKFQLIIAANPCPCGYAYGNGERCTCKEKDRIRYFSRLSGPILDRIDIQMDVPPVERIIIPQNTRDIRSNVDNSNLSNNEKNNYETNKLEQQSYIKQNNLNNNALYNGKPILTSAMMRKNVTTARRIAQVRFVKQGWNCNAQASGTWLRKYTSKHALMLVNNALEKHQLSLRGADRALRLAWTLADIAGHVSPDVTDMAQAISLRTRI